MKAIIMAGGKGSRLRPLTEELPKPMIPIINKPIMQHIIELLKKHGITEIAVTVGYMAEKIINYFGHGEKLGVELTYFVEDYPLGTAGSVKNALSFIDDKVIIISGDAFTNINLTRLVRAHEKSEALATLATVKLRDARGFGLVECDEIGRITSFIEKPQMKIAGIVNTGIYVLERKLIASLPDGFLDFGKDVFPNMQNGLFAYNARCYWSDIGTLASYYSTNYYVATKLYKDII